MSSAEKIAAIFPGQGAQSVGMLSELAANHASIKLRFAEASDVVGFDLWAMTEQGPSEVWAKRKILSPHCSPLALRYGICGLEPMRRSP